MKTDALRILDQEIARTERLLATLQKSRELLADAWTGKATKAHADIEKPSATGRRPKFKTCDPSYAALCQAFPRRLPIADLVAEHRRAGDETTARKLYHWLRKDRRFASYGKSGWGLTRAPRLISSGAVEGV